MCGSKCRTCVPEFLVQLAAIPSPVNTSYFKGYTKGIVIRLFRKFIFVLAGFLMLAPTASFAADTLPANFLDRNTTMPQPAGLSSCFDHYQFGSVPAVLSPSLSSVSQSATIGFTGTVTNQNAYPISDVTVIAKIFHNRTSLDANGPDVVDEFPVATHVNLAAKQSLPITATWKVPKDADVGNYQIATYVISSERFELSGLIFTDDVTGGAANFKVIGNEVGTTRFVKDTAMMVGHHFGFAAFPPVIPANTTSFPVTIDVGNTSSSTYVGTIAWSLYYWDDQLPSHLLNSTSENVQIAAHASTTATYMVTDTAHSTYYLVGVLTTAGGSKSIVGIRFTRANVNEPRINFVTLDGNTAVACVHSAGTASAPDSQIKLSVTKDTWYSPLLQLVGLGNVASVSYSGPIPGEIFAVTAPLSHLSGSYILRTSLYQNGKQVDTVNENYSCKDLGVPCANNLWSIVIAVAIVIVLIIVVAGIVLFVRRRSLTEPVVTNL